VERAPGRLQPRARELHRRGVVTTYRLHNRLLSNRRSRALYAAHRPSLDDTQRHVSGGNSLSALRSEKPLSWSSWTTRRCVSSNEGRWAA